jgi:hypothetical protein
MFLEYNRFMKKIGLTGPYQQDQQQQQHHHHQQQQGKEDRGTRTTTNNSISIKWGQVIDIAPILELRPD